MTIRVVIADDHAVVRLGLRALLAQSADIEVVGEASDGAEALRKCAELRPNVVIMDLSMEGMDGLEAIRQLTRRPDAPRVLAVTMHDESDYLVPALDAGATGLSARLARVQPPCYPEA
jgi:DNA-binding NarL/FixJ family response regulator